MASYSTNQLKNGLKFMLNGDPCNILDLDFVKPGKGQAFTRIKYRNLRTGRVNELTIKSNESIESADVMEMELEYSYTDGEFWHFMDPTTFEQHAADATAIADTKNWLREQVLYTVTLWNSAPLSVTAPNFVNLKVAETDPGLRGDTSGGGGKPATLETGAVVRVPLFIEIGELLRVDTRTGEYVERAKEE